MANIKLLIWVACMFLSVLCKASDKEPKQYRIGLLTGLGASGTISKNNTTIMDFNYTTRIGGGWALQNVYFIFDTRNKEQNRLSVKFGYFATSASIPVFLSNTNTQINTNFAREVNSNYKFHFIHIPIDYHAKVYVGNDNQRVTSLIAGVDLALALSAKSSTSIKPLGASMFTNYITPQLDSKNYSSIQMGVHIGWQFEKEISEHKSWIAGYTVTGFFNDLVKENNTKQIPILYKDGYNLLLTNLMFVGLIF
jgi:Ni,Fe-hydrogenase III component G